MNDRPSRDEVMMAHAHVASLRGTCTRLRVGVVLARSARVLMTGYNGTPAGMPHCDHTCTCPALRHGMREYAADRMGVHRDGCPDDSPCLTAVHAEANAIAFAAREGIVVDGSEMFTTHQPCLACAMLIINAGIMRVVYRTPYRLSDGTDLLRQATVEVEQWKGR